MRYNNLDVSALGPKKRRTNKEQTPGRSGECGVGSGEFFHSSLSTQNSELIL